MTVEQKQAYEWAKNQDYQLVSARYAKTLADLVDELQAEIERLQNFDPEDVSKMFMNCEKLNPIPLCKVRDVLYSIVDCTHRPEKVYVTAVHMYEKYNSITALSKGQREYVFEDNDFGEVVFFSENEALEALNKKGVKSDG